MNKKSRYQARIGKVLIIISVILLVGLFLFVSCSKPKVYRVGVLCGVKYLYPIVDSFKARMTELGYEEGKNIIYDVHNTEFDMAVYDRILKKFVADKVDLIFAYPTEAAMQAKAVTQSIPIVFSSVLIEDVDLVNSVQEPGENITGVRWPGPEIIAGEVEIFMELVPQAKRMWVFYQRGIPIVKSQLEAMRKAALSANVKLIEVPASSPAELETELQKQTGPFDAAVIGMLAEPLMANPQAYTAVSKFAARYNMPIAGAPVFEVDYPTVFGFTPDPVLQGKQVAYLADKIFKGTPAGKLPVVTADNFFIFNYRQAEKLKLNITESLLRQADKIIR
jgi:putative ABC transport system substrate-binding protein